MNSSIPPSSSSESIEQAAARWIVRRDAGLTPAEAEAFAAWQAESPAHARAITEFDATWDFLDQSRAKGRAPALLARLGRRARSRRRAATAATALLALVAFGWFWRWPAPSRPEALAGAATRAVVVTPATQTLPDGSVVELKFGAQLALEFRPEVRRVVLKQGEAHFAVAKDSHRPFIVSAGGVEFRAVGTVFSVQLGSNRVEMLVTEGRVAVDQPTADPTDTPPANPLVIDAGKGVVVGLGGVASPDLLAFTPAELAAKLAWRAPRLEFTDTPLAEAVALMNQHAAGRGTARLVLEDDASAALPVSGMFRADNTGAFVRILEVNFGLKAVTDGDTIVLRRTP